MQFLKALVVAGLLVVPGAASAADLACTVAGPQAPRDISVKDGKNAKMFALAPAPTQMNLCNIHYHERAEHRGPGFTTASQAGAGFTCDGASSLPAEAKKAVAKNVEACEHLVAGSTVEVHWVYTSCPVTVEKGKGLASCTACENPTLRVEAQVFLVVNDPKAVDFTTYDYSGKVGNFLQAKSLPPGTGTPVTFRGSTTGGSYNETTKCSPAQATWSVRQSCAKVDITSLHRWCKSNVYGEHDGHDVRPLVKNPAFLGKIL